MEPEPESDFPDVAQRFHPLSKRIDKQDEHHRPTDQADPITYPRFGQNGGQDGSLDTHDQYDKGGQSIAKPKDSLDLAHAQPIGPFFAHGRAVRHGYRAHCDVPTYRGTPKKSAHEARKGVRHGGINGVLPLTTSNAAGPAEQESLHKMTEFFPLLLTLIAGVVIGVVAVRFLSANKSTQALDKDAAASAIPQDKNVDLIAATMDAPKPSAAASGSAALKNISKKQWILGSTGVLALAAVIVFTFGPDGTASTPTVGELGSSDGFAPNANAANLDDVDTMIQKLADRLKTDTEDGEGFRMLGWSYQNTNRPAEAVAAYKRAVGLLPDRADVCAGYGEALVSLANGRVTPEALGAVSKGD